jgi:hypothetical protein
MIDEVLLNAIKARTTVIEDNIIDQLVKKFGFDSEQDFNSLTSTIDLSTPQKIQAFKKWQNEDCTKSGLLKIKDL